MIVMCLAWLFLSRRESGRSVCSAPDSLLSDPGIDGGIPKGERIKYHDLVDIDTVDLTRDEYDEGDDTGEEDEVASRLSGKMKLLWTFYYWLV